MCFDVSLLILGACTRAAAFSARRAGFVTACADLFADRDLAAVGPVQRIDPERYPDGLARAADDAPDGPWLYTGAIENHPDLIDRISASRPLWGNAGAVARAVRDPLSVAEVLRRAGLPCPEVRAGPERLPRDGTWLVKPLASAGGIGIEPLGPGFDENGPQRPSYYQKRLDGPSFAALFVGPRLVGVTRQEVGRPGAEFAYSGSIGPCPVMPRLREGLAALGATLVSAFGLAGLFGVDFLTRDDRPWPVEINPRYTASVEVLERALGRSLLAEHARAFDPSVPVPTPGLGSEYAGKRVLYALAPGRFPDRAGNHSIPCPAGKFPRVADVPWPGTWFAPGEPVMTVFARGASLESCRLRLDRKEAAWHKIVVSREKERPTQGSCYRPIFTDY